MCGGGRGARETEGGGLKGESAIQGYIAQTYGFIDSKNMAQLAFIGL